MHSALAHIHAQHISALKPCAALCCFVRIAQNSHAHKADGGALVSEVRARCIKWSAHSLASAPGSVLTSSLCTLCFQSKVAQSHDVSTWVNVVDISFHCASAPGRVTLWPGGCKEQRGDQARPNKPLAACLAFLLAHRRALCQRQLGVHGWLHLLPSLVLSLQVLARQIGLLGKRLHVIVATANE